MIISSVETIPFINSYFVGFEFSRVGDGHLDRVMKTFKSMHIASRKVVDQSMDAFLTTCSELKLLSGIR